VGIIDLGKIIALDTPTHLKRSIEQLDIVKIEVEQFDPSSVGVLNQFPTVENVVSRHLGTDSAWSLAIHSTDSDKLLPNLIPALSGRMTHLQIVQPTLEDVFISLTGKQLRD
jgi:ABC-2 type transport system ATP-binding protein